MVKEENEMYIMGSLNEISSKKITSKRKREKENKILYTFQGQDICRDAFVLIYDTTQKVLRNIAKHLNEKGAIPPEHGNTGKK